MNEMHRVVVRGGRVITDLESTPADVEKAVGSPVEPPPPLLVSPPPNALSPFAGVAADAVLLQAYRDRRRWVRRVGWFYRVLAGAVAVTFLGAIAMYVVNMGLLMWQWWRA